MIIFARAPGTAGWVEIKPEEELSHRGQFWEIRKFAVEQEDAMPLARRLDCAEQALRAAGFKYHGPSEKWLAPATQAVVPENAMMQAMQVYGLPMLDIQAIGQAARRYAKEVDA